MVYRDARRLIQREQIRVVVDEFERCRRNVWLFALDGVLEAVSRSEDGLRVDGLPIEPQPPTTHRLVQVRLGALRGKLVAQHVQHASAEPAALGEGGEGVLVRHHVTAAVENRVEACTLLTHPRRLTRRALALAHGRRHRPQGRRAVYFECAVVPGNRL